MAFVGEPPWHGLGKEAPPDADVAEMIAAAGLDWRVWLQPAPGVPYDPRTETHDRYLVMRPALGSETSNVALGWVGPAYQPLQNIDAFRFFEPFLERGWANLETAGALGRGELVWVQARLKDDINIGENDSLRRYILVSNSHDGSRAVTVRFTCVRVVCQNTLTLAHGNRSSMAVASVRHTRNLRENLRFEQASKLKEVADTVFGKAERLFGGMAAYSMSAEKTEDYLEGLFPRTETQKSKGKKPRRWKRVETILNDDQVTPGQTRNTLWGLYNAVVRDEDFRRSTQEAGPAARLRRVWFGKGSQLKLRALESAQKLVSDSKLILT